MDVEKCSNCSKDIPKSSIELHIIHCKRNYLLCECGDLINRQYLDEHTKEKHTLRACVNCGLELLPSALANHDCPSQPKICQFCTAEFPLNQFSEHLYHCSSRTEQCPRCQKYIQIRDFDHHLEQVDCLGVRDTYQENLDRITNEVLANFTGDPQDIESEILRRLSEHQDMLYAEDIYKKMLLERSPSKEERVERIERVEEISEEVKVSEANERSEYEDAVLQSLRDAPPEMNRGISESSWGVSDEDQLMNEAILKSLQDR